MVATQEDKRGYYLEQAKHPHRKVTINLVTSKFSIIFV